MVEGDFVPGGPAKCHLKDTSTALACASELGLTLPTLRQVDGLFSSLVSHDGADLDHSALIVELRGLNEAVPAA